jgi:hypothetical protein
MVVVLRLSRGIAVDLPDVLKGQEAAFRIKVPTIRRSWVMIG